jgi:hypothetical protein
VLPKSAFEARIGRSRDARTISPKPCELELMKN